MRKAGAAGGKRQARESIFDSVAPLRSVTFCYSLDTLSSGVAAWRDARGEAHTRPRAGYVWRLGRIGHMGVSRGQSIGQRQQGLGRSRKPCEAMRRAAYKVARDSNPTGDAIHSIGDAKRSWPHWAESRARR